MARSFAPRARTALAVSAIAVLSLAALAAPAARAETTIPFTNWHVGGSLGIKKLHQRIDLPAGSRFNGNANLTRGTISGHTTIPDFTATVRILGVPTRVDLSIKEAAPTTGTLSLNPDGTVTTDVRVKSDLRIRRLRLGLLSVPAGANCHTSSPVVLPLHFHGPLDLSGGFAFNGTYSIPKLRGCGLLTPTLNLLMAGPANPFTITLKPPP